MSDVSTGASNMERITLVGVHHRHQVSIAEVEDAILENRPGVVAVELPSDDYLRFLEARSYLETEMKVAIITACEVGARVYLIDLRKTHLERRLRRTLGVGDSELWRALERGDIPAFYRRLQAVAPEALGRAKEVLLLEREAAMAAKLLRLAEEHPGERILAVVGHTHTRAIEEFLGNRAALGEVIRRRGLAVGEPFPLACEDVMVYS